MILVGVEVEKNTKSVTTLISSECFFQKIDIIMPKKKNFWTKSTPKFREIHIFLGIVSLVLILISSFFILKRIFPRSFIPDIYEMTQLPSDVKEKMSTSVHISFKIPILIYHYVEYVKDKGDKIRISLNIEPWAFDEQVKTLKDAGYTFITPNQITQYFGNKINLPEKPVILTFDDGYRDFYTDVFPILKKYNVKAVAYIVPGFLDKPNNLTHWQLKEIAKSDLVEIAAHTVNHAYLKGLPEKRVRFEIEESKKMLEKELGIPVVSFAYPYGVFDLQAIEEVKKAGFKNAVSTIDGVDISQDNIFFMYRLRAGYRTGQSLLDFIEKSLKINK